MPEGNEERALWDKLEDTRRELHHVDRRTGQLETRMQANEDTQELFRASVQELSTEVRGLRDDLRAGKAVFRTLIKVGAIGGALLSFGAWLWVELKKLGH